MSDLVAARRSAADAVQALRCLLTDLHAPQDAGTLPEPASLLDVTITLAVLLDMTGEVTERLETLTGEAGNLADDWASRTDELSRRRRRAATTAATRLRYIAEGWSATADTYAAAASQLDTLGHHIRAVHENLKALTPTPGER